jgi:hypothetical protein
LYRFFNSLSLNAIDNIVYIAALENFYSVNFASDYDRMVNNDERPENCLARLNLPFAIAAPTAFATSKYGGRTISPTPTKVSGATMLPPPTSNIVTSSGEVFILHGINHYNLCL